MGCCLDVIQKRKKIDKFFLETLRDIVKQGADHIIKRFEDKFKELKIEGCRRDGGSSPSVLYTEDEEFMDEDHLDDPETEMDMDVKETLFMGKESEARRRFRNNGPYRQRYLSQESRNDGSRRQSGYGGGRNVYCDQS